MIENEFTDSQTLKRKLKENIERIEGFEEKLGISLQNISVNVSKELDMITLIGEIIKTNPDINIDHFHIISNFYNDCDEIIYRDTESIYNFEGYDSFQIVIYDTDIIVNINKIRIYVKG